MSDTFDSYVQSPSSVPAKAKSILDAMPKVGSNGVALCLNDAAIRKLLDVIATLG